MSLMSSSNDARVVPPLERGKSPVEEEKFTGSTSEISSGAFGFSTVVSNVEAGRVGGDESDETRFFGNVSDSRVLTIENEEIRFHGSGGGENKPSSSVCRLPGSSERSIPQSGKLEHKKNMSAAEDYDSILSAFDKFAAKGNDAAVGHGFQIGDMVWGKVKSHPWWPGHIYNEALVPRSVRRGKQEGHVLVAFFGDSSYGWFDPAELIPFEENFTEKSMQTTSRSFLKAVEEAADEITRRSSLGLACRCRNQFSPSSVEGYVVVDDGDSDAGVYSLSQISKAHDTFRPRDMVSFVHQVALNPMNDERFSIDFIKQKAVALAVRKMRFEDFDETYAQAFGTQPLRPSRPTAPATMDPSTAPLRGRLVFAETLGKKNISAKPANAKGQVEKDKYLSRRQEESIPLKSKKASSIQVGHFPRPLSVNKQYSGVTDHMHQASESCSTEGRHLPISQQASNHMKPSDSSRKHVEGGTKKVKFLKRPAGKSTDDNAIRVKKEKKKVINPDTGGERRELPLAVRHITENVLGMPACVHPSENSVPEDQKIDAALGLSSSQSQQADDFVKMELQMFVRDLRAVACNPFHGEQKSCQAVIKQVFLKYRSLVYQKSLVVVPPAESEANAGIPSRLPMPTPAVADKIVKPSVRLDDPTKGGKKRDRPNAVQKKKLDVSEGVKRKKLDESLESKRKKMDSSKSLAVEKKELDESLEFKRKKMDSSKSLTVEKKELDESLESKRKKMDGSKSLTVEKEELDEPLESKRKKMDGAKSLTVEKKELDESLGSKRKKMDSSKSLSVEKKVIIQRSSESLYGDAKDSAPQIRAVKQESNKRTGAGQMTRSATPTMLMMKFPADAALPSIPQLKVKFARFGPLDQSATRVFWKTYTCRLVYQHKIDAQAALKFAVGSSNLFGSANVRCYIREVGGEGAESEPVKAPQNKEDTEPRPVAAKTASEQLRSCLKKPSGDEAGNGGAGKSARVKFVLGGDDSSLPLNENNINKIASFGTGGSSIHSTSKNLPKINNPQPSNTFAPPFQQVPAPEQGIRPKTAPGDISQQMLNLLTRCNDVVNNLSAALGCVPYHPL
ncbi:DNA (cytosine-5-)-methyltransferase [Salvia divinorum]